MIPTASPATIADFSALDSASISDALDRLGISGQPLGIRPLMQGWRTCGPAFTVRYRSVDLVHPGTVGDFIDDVDPGAVVVIDNAGRMDATVWGDLMTTVAAQNEVAGTVIHGVSRDTTRAVELAYPIFARSTFMRTGKDRVQLDEIGGAVDVGDLTVHMGDIIFGDSDGVVVVPCDRASEVLDVASEIDATEARIRGLVVKGDRLDTARRHHGYHELQSRAE